MTAGTFRSMEKSRAKQVFQTFRVSKVGIVNEYEVEYKEHRFYQSLTSGLVGFSEFLNSCRNTRPINLSIRNSLRLNNIVMRLDESTGYLERESCQALELEPMVQPVVDEHYQKLAEGMIGTNDLNQSLKEYFWVSVFGD